MQTITEREFKQLADFIKSFTGIYLKEEKQSLLTGRLGTILAQNNFDNFSDYYNFVVSDKSGSALSILIDKITTNHTYFMREEDHFYYFRDTVLPFIASTNKERDIRIWSAGCSTGEEPYVLAMIIDEFFGKEKCLWNTKILATDISTRALTIAKKGVYTNENMTPVPQRWKLNYFRKIDDKSSTITAAIKGEVIFRNLNLMMDKFPFKKKFHTIFCRNVMIYFDNQTKIDLVNKLYEITEPGGFLFIGHSESLIRDETKYTYIMPALFRKV
jgi:chemotaxis protein methyltransferase CheR